MRKFVCFALFTALSLPAGHALGKERIDVTVSYPVAPQRPLPPGLNAVAVLDAAVRADENGDERARKWSLIAGDMIEAMLLSARDRFGSPLAVADRRNMQLVLQEHDLRAAGLVDAPAAAQMGQLLAVQGIITANIDIEVNVQQRTSTTVDWPMMFGGLIQGVAGGPAYPPPQQTIIVEPRDEGRYGGPHDQRDRDRRGDRDRDGNRARGNDRDRDRDGNRARDNNRNDRRFVSRVRTLRSNRARMLYRRPVGGLPSGGGVIRTAPPPPPPQQHQYQPKAEYGEPRYVPPTSVNPAGVHGPGTYVEPARPPAGIYYPPGTYPQDYPPPAAPGSGSGPVVVEQPPVYVEQPPAYYAPGAPVTYVAPAFGTREVQEISQHLSVQCSFALIDAVTGQTIMRFTPPPYRKTDTSSPTFLYGGVVDESQLNPIDHFIGELVERATQEFVSMLAPVDVSQTYTLVGRGHDGEQAVRLLRGDDFNGAAALFERQAREDDDKAECAFAAGVAFAMIGRFEDALQYLRNAASSRDADREEAEMYQAAARRLSEDLPRIMRPADPNAPVRYGEVMIATDESGRRDDD
jgi:hypothetical protein